MKIKRLKISNFRNLIDFEIDNCPDTIILAGPNGSGKSSVLEAIGILKETAAPYYSTRTIPGMVTVGADFCEIEADIEICDTEKAFLERQGKAVDATLYKCLVRFNNLGSVIQTSRDENVRILLQHYEPGSGVGIVEYLNPYRRMPHSRLQAISLTGMSLEIEKRRRIYEVETKFNELKEYLATLTLRDLQIFMQTGQKQDSLAVIKQVFNDFFNPKTFAGVEIGEGEMYFWVDTPSGRHDIDNLSSGEQEIFMVFLNLLKLKLRGSILLYDEPDLHLNAALQRRLLSQLKAVGADNQIWIATHSADIVGSASYDEIFHMKLYEGGNQVGRLEEDVEKLSIFKSLGASIGVQLSSERVIFLEGNDPGGDKEILERLFPQYLNRISFVPTGSVTALMGVATRATELLKQASTYAQFYLIRDRDFLSEDDVKRIKEEYGGRLFVWNRYEIENYFLDSALVLHVLKSLGVSKWDNEMAVENALLEVANELKEDTLLAWANFELENRMGAFSFKGKGDTIEDKLKDGANRAIARFNEQLPQEKILEVIAEKRKRVSQEWTKGLWRIICPGQRILRSFAGKHCPGVRYDYFRNLIVSEMIEQEKIPNDFKQVISQILEE